MKFEKWTALGNDYLIVEAAALPWEPTPARIKRLCDPHFGVGSDGLLLLSPVEDPAYVAELRIFNPDGSEAELSGNGAREAVLYLRRSGWTDEDEFTILTKAGPITPRIRSEREATLEMGKASPTSPDYPSGAGDGRGEVLAAGRTWDFRHLSIGNPQCAIDVGAELESLDLRTLGPEIENSPLFPNRTNVSFYRVDGARVRARIFERGVGETLASGTGAAGAALAAHLDGAPSTLTVELDGGELEVELGPELSVRLTGWAEPLFSGELSAELLRILETIG
ncbi:MAG TPA: diaminopimelate epimerase [Solirubrobacterales bacterium]|nr:diaminopimelate epimerase [Solirubrobacterales bacterium]